jgi:hypothetical protein
VGTIAQRVQRAPEGKEMAFQAMVVAWFAIKKGAQQVSSNLA